MATYVHIYAYHPELFTLHVRVHVHIHVYVTARHVDQVYATLPGLAFDMLMHTYPNDVCIHMCTHVTLLFPKITMYVCGT